MNLGTGDAVTVTFTGTCFAVRQNTLSVLVANAEVGTDDGAGNITGATIAAGTVNYTTGAVSVTFTAAPGLASSVDVNYQANTETDTDALRELDLGLNVISVSAEPHPLLLSWSIRAELAASASIGLDVEDTATIIAGQLIKIERDRQLIRYIETLAGAVNANLIFSAAAVAGYPRMQVFNDWKIQLATAENIIFTNSGKGAVSWVVAGVNCCEVISNLTAFVAEPNVVPIGAHVIGSVGGTTVIKDPYLTTNEYLVGYNGILPGDSGVIIADKTRIQSHCIVICSCKDGELLETPVRLNGYNVTGNSERDMLENIQVGTISIQASWKQVEGSETILISLSQLIW